MNFMQSYEKKCQNQKYRKKKWKNFIQSSLVTNSFNKKIILWIPGVDGT